MKTVTYLIIILFISSCANKNAKLVGNRSFIYGARGQTINGDSKSVSVFNIWSAKDGKGVAEQHCQKYNKIVTSMSFSGIF